MRKVQIHATCFATDSWGNPGVQFEAGGIYPVDQDSKRQVVLGNGSYIEVDDQAPEPEASASASAETAAVPADASASPAAVTSKKAPKA